MEVELKVKEIVENTFFKRNINDLIRKFNNQIKMRPLPAPGMRYKTSIVDTLIKRGHFNEEYFIKNCISVWNKTSPLPRSERDFILFICNSALEKVIEDKKL